MQFFVPPSFSNKSLLFVCLILSGAKLVLLLPILAISTITALLSTLQSILPLPLSLLSALPSLLRSLPSLLLALLLLLSALLSGLLSLLSALLHALLLLLMSRCLHSRHCWQHSYHCCLYCYHCWELLPLLDQLDLVYPASQVSNYCEGQANQYRTRHSANFDSFDFFVNNSNVINWTQSSERKKVLATLELL